MQGAVLLTAQPLRVKLLWSSDTSRGNQSATAGTGNPSLMAAAGPKWAQKTVMLPPHRRGCHLITPKIMKEIGQDLSEFKCGIAHIFLQHTSASLTINENYDSDVRSDTETFLNKIVPEARMTCQHTLNHQCLAVHSRFQLQMESLIWVLGREYGYVSTETTPLHAILWSPSMEFRYMLRVGASVYPAISAGCINVNNKLVSRCLLGKTGL